MKQLEITMSYKNISLSSIKSNVSAFHYLDKMNAVTLFRIYLNAGKYQTPEIKYEHFKNIYICIKNFAVCNIENYCYIVSQFK